MKRGEVLHQPASKAKQPFSSFDHGLVFSLAVQHKAIFHCPEHHRSRRDFDQSLDARGACLDVLEFSQSAQSVVTMP